MLKLAARNRVGFHQLPVDHHKSRVIYNKVLEAPGTAQGGKKPINAWFQNKQSVIKHITNSFFRFFNISRKWRPGCESGEFCIAYFFWHKNHNDSHILGITHFAILGFQICGRKLFDSTISMNEKIVLECQCMSIPQTSFHHFQEKRVIV